MNLLGARSPGLAPSSQAGSKSGGCPGFAAWGYFAKIEPL